MLAAAGFLTYTRVTFKFAPQVKRQYEFKEFMQKKNKYAVKGNILGDEDAKVIVYIYSDYQCPICPVHNVMMHKLAKEMKGIKIVHRNLPLDISCNGYLQAPFHDGSCIDAKYAIAAEKQGRFWEMNNMLFEKTPQTEEAVLKYAAEMGFDTEKLQQDANSPDTAKEIKAQIDDAYKRGIQGTPSTMINNEAYVGIKTYKEYKEWVEKLGAEKR